MQHPTNFETWRNIERQIEALGIAPQIENLRRQLAEDWRFRTSHCKTPVSNPINDLPAIARNDSTTELRNSA
jgi:hypothetical protein